MQRRPTLPLTLSSPAPPQPITAAKKRASLARTPEHALVPLEFHGENGNAVHNTAASTSRMPLISARPSNPFHKPSSTSAVAATTTMSLSQPISQSSQTARPPPASVGPLSPQFARPLVRKMARHSGADTGSRLSLSQTLSQSQSQSHQPKGSQVLKQSTLSFGKSVASVLMFGSQGQDRDPAEVDADASCSQLYSQPMPAPLDFGGAASQCSQGAHERATQVLTQNLLAMNVNKHSSTSRLHALRQSQSDDGFADGNDNNGDNTDGHSTGGQSLSSSFVADDVEVERTNRATVRASQQATQRLNLSIDLASISQANARRMNSEEQLSQLDCCTPADQPVRGKNQFEMAEDMIVAKHEHRGGHEFVVTQDGAVFAVPHAKGTAGSQKQHTTAFSQSQSQSPLRASSTRAPPPPPPLAHSSTASVSARAPQRAHAPPPPTARKPAPLTSLVINCGVTSSSRPGLSASLGQLAAAPPPPQCNFFLPLAATASATADAAKRASKGKLNVSASMAAANSRLHHDFEVIEELGAGAYGCVFRCRHRLDGCEYAVKRVQRKMLGDARKRDQLREVFALAALQHAGMAAYPASLVRYYNAWIDDGHLFVQTELCARGNLASQARRAPGIGIGSDERSSFDERTLLRVALHTARALAFMHANNIAHLDVKPENILEAAPGDAAPVVATAANLADQRVFKLADFGMCVPLTGAESPCVRGTELHAEGDRRYCSREVMLGSNLSAETLKASDVFSLGLSLFDLARGDQFGTLPDDGPQWDQLRYGVLPSVAAPPPPARARTAAASPSPTPHASTASNVSPSRTGTADAAHPLAPDSVLRNLIQSMISAQPTLRPTAAELVDLLEAHLSPAPSPVAAHSDCASMEHDETIATVHSMCLSPTPSAHPPPLPSSSSSFSARSASLPPQPPPPAGKQQPWTSGAAAASDAPPLMYSPFLSPGAAPFSTAKQQPGTASAFTAPHSITVNLTPTPGFAMHTLAPSPSPSPPFDVDAHLKEMSALRAQLDAQTAETRRLEAILVGM